MLYSHSEFNPDVSIRHCKVIQLTPDMEYYTPSEIADYRVHMNRSIDLVMNGETITFVSDPSFPNSSNFILTVRKGLRRNA